MFVVKYIPEWFPGAGFQRWASKGRRMVNEMMEGRHVVQRLGSAQVCFATKLIEEGGYFHVCRTTVKLTLMYC